MTLMTAFGVMAVALAAVGVFGIMSHAVRERTREIAIRMALGASKGTVLTMLFTRGLRLSLGGILVGAALALAFANVLKGLLFGVGTRDWATFLSMPLVLVAVAMIAVWIPARRVSRLNPIAALRQQ
jgi:ABC-type antimicrobial peptide transport system permease subunit